LISSLSTGNDELDLRLGGGLPYPALILLEGDHGTGKSLLVSQFIYGALKKDNKKVILITTENTVKSLLEQMKKISFNLDREFILGKLYIIPIHMEGVKWAERTARYLLEALSRYMERMKKHYDIFVIDSLTTIAVYSTPSVVLDFLTKCRTLVSEGKMIIITIHPHALSENLLINARALCDCYFKLALGEMGGKTFKIMEIIKLKGASGPVEGIINFDIEPAFGIKILPLAGANV
jgi:flagellar protein FlaH